MNARARSIAYVALWLVLSIAGLAYGFRMMTSPDADKRVFLPGETTEGHHQIELACSACHTESYADRDAIQEACEACHADALKAAKDDHPRSKFTDPRNADRLAVLDARYCATCHVEHRPEITGEMGLTLPGDYCFLCHEDVAADRPSHQGMAFDSCASAGCHNFHDNRALYEDFLIKHLDEPDTASGGMLLLGNFLEIAEQLPEYPKDEFPIEPLGADAADAPEGARDPEVVAEWASSSHAAAGVNCRACHTLDADAPWSDQPDRRSCARCHAGEEGAFLQGKHGMRLDQERLGIELEPMSVGLARRPMKPAALGRTLGCTSCHGAHAFDARAATVAACLECHDDEHSLAYEGSPHHRLWELEQAGDVAPGAGVSCASCHMPRVARDYFWGSFTHNEVQHNQSETLQPNEKMIRPVCLSCHGLAFTLDALADRELIDRNFAGAPSVHVESMDLARRRSEPVP